MSSCPDGFYVFLAKGNGGCRYLYIMEIQDEFVLLYKMYIEDDTHKVSLALENRTLPRNVLNNSGKGDIFELTEEEFLLETSDLI